MFSFYEALRQVERGIVISLLRYDSPIYTKVITIDSSDEEDYVGDGTSDPVCGNLEYVCQINEPGMITLQRVSNEDSSSSASMPELDQVSTEDSSSPEDLMNDEDYYHKGKKRASSYVPTVSKMKEQRTILERFRTKLPKSSKSNVCGKLLKFRRTCQTRPVGRPRKINPYMLQSPSHYFKLGCKNLTEVHHESHPGCENLTEVHHESHPSATLSKSATSFTAEKSLVKETTLIPSSLEEPLEPATIQKPTTSHTAEKSPMKESTINASPTPLPAKRPVKSSTPTILQKPVLAAEKSPVKQTTMDPFLIAKPSPASVKKPVKPPAPTTVQKPVSTVEKSQVKEIMDPPIIEEHSAVAFVKEPVEPTAPTILQKPTSAAEKSLVKNTTTDQFLIEKPSALTSVKEPVKPPAPTIVQKLATSHTAEKSLSRETTMDQLSTSTIEQPLVEKSALPATICPLTASSTVIKSVPIQLSTVTISVEKSFTSSIIKKGYTSTSVEKSNALNTAPTSIETSSVAKLPEYLAPIVEKQPSTTTSNMEISTNLVPTSTTIEESTSVPTFSTTLEQTRRTLQKPSIAAQQISSGSNTMLNESFMKKSTSVTVEQPTLSEIKEEPPNECTGIIVERPATAVVEKLPTIAAVRKSVIKETTMEQLLIEKHSATMKNPPVSNTISIMQKILNSCVVAPEKQTRPTCVDPKQSPVTTYPMLLDNLKNDGRNAARHKLGELPVLWSSSDAGNFADQWNINGDFRHNNETTKIRVKTPREVCLSHKPTSVITEKSCRRTWHTPYYKTSTIQPTIPTNTIQTQHSNLVPSAISSRKDSTEAAPYNYSSQKKPDVKARPQVESRNSNQAKAVNKSSINGGDTVSNTGKPLSVPSVPTIPADMSASQDTKAKIENVMLYYSLRLTSILAHYACFKQVENVEFTSIKNRLEKDCMSDPNFIFYLPKMIEHTIIQYKMSYKTLDTGLKNVLNNIVPETVIQKYQLNSWRGIVDNLFLKYLPTSTQRQSTKRKNIRASNVATANTKHQRSWDHNTLDHVSQQHVANPASISSEFQNVANPAIISSEFQNFANPATISSTFQNVATPAIASSTFQNVATSTVAPSAFHNVATPAIASSTFQNVATSTVAPSAFHNVATSVIASSAFQNVAVKNAPTMASSAFQQEYVATSAFHHTKQQWSQYSNQVPYQQHFQQQMQYSQRSQQQMQHPQRSQQQLQHPQQSQPFVTMSHQMSQRSENSAVVMRSQQTPSMYQPLISSPPIANSPPAPLLSPQIPSASGAANFNLGALSQFVNQTEFDYILNTATATSQCRNYPQETISQQVLGTTNFTHNQGAMGVRTNFQYQPSIDLPPYNQIVHNANNNFQINVLNGNTPTNVIGPQHTGVISDASSNMSAQKNLFSVTSHRVEGRLAYNSTCYNEIQARSTRAVVQNSFLNFMDDL